IQKTLAETTNLTLSALRKQTGKDPYAPIVESASGVYRFVELFEWVYLYFFIDVYEYVYVVIYIPAALSAEPVEGVGTVKGVTRLEREQWINLIATRLSSKGR